MSGAEGVETLRRRVPAHWIDANGHMNEARYLQAFSRASDALLAMAGVDAVYVESGFSFFTVETHLRHLGEARPGAVLVARSRILRVDGVKLLLFQRLEAGDGALLATGEHLMLHVDLATRRACRPPEPVTARLTEMAARMAGPPPEGAGRAVGDPR